MSGACLKRIASMTPGSTWRRNLDTGLRVDRALESAAGAEQTFRSECLADLFNEAHGHTVSWLHLENKGESAAHKTRSGRDWMIVIRQRSNAK